MNDKQKRLRLSRCRGAMGCLVVGFTLLPLLCGCGGETNGSSTSRAEQHEVEFADGTTAEVVKQNGRPVSLTLPDGETIRLMDAETIVDDQLVIRTTDGQVEVVRKPTAVMKEIDRLPFLYLKDDSLEELITDGFRGEPYVGPGDVLYWGARTCTHADCASQTMGTAQRPYLLVWRISGFVVTPEGTVVGTGPPTFSKNCPVCNRADGVRVYLLPETVRRREELRAELEKARAARTRAATWTR